MRQNRLGGIATQSDTHPVNRDIVCSVSASSCSSFLYWRLVGS